MKKLLLATVMAAVALSFAPSSAALKGTKTLRFDAAVPCSVVACSYWQPHEESPGTFAVLPELAGTDLDGTPAEGAADLPFEKNTDAAYAKQTGYGCSDPFMAETYTDRVLTVPSRVRTVRIKYTPGIDWDMFLCSKPRVGNNGKMLAFETVNASGCSDYVETLDFGSIGCPSSIYAKVKPGQKIVVRAYNFLDVDPLTARLYWYS